jgi:hypothetical protein
MAIRPLAPSAAWRPPGYCRRRLDEHLIQLDTEFSAHVVEPEARRRLAAGSLLHWLRHEDLAQLQEEDGETTLARAAARLQGGETGGLSLRSYGIVSDKDVADCVEAVIGSVLLHSGQGGALAAMANLGINLSAGASLAALLRGDSSPGPVLPFPPQPDAFRDDYAREQAGGGRATTLYAKLAAEVVEEKLGYTFRERSFLLQALTHASYTGNQLTESYERLEFLGDAVLDYLVTAHLFTSSKVGSISQRFPSD